LELLAYSSKNKKVRTVQCLAMRPERDQVKDSVANPNPECQSRLGTWKNDGVFQSTQ
jgi:hypothetical protein